MKPIGISAEFLQPGKVGGVEFFLKNLFAGMVESLAPGEKIRVIGSRENLGHLPDRIEIIPPSIRRGNRFARETCSHFRLGGSFRCLYYPNYFTPPLPGGCRVVTTVHDAQYRHFPQNFSAKKRLWLNAAHRMTLAKADRVITISEFVKRDLLEIYGAKWENKITAVHIPVSWERFGREDESGRAGLPPRFVLSVAAQYPHKNLATLIRAFKKVREAQPEVGLVLAGQLPENLIGSNRGADLRALARELGLEKAVTVTGHVSDEELGRLYRHAEVFAFPSLFEGFGIPPVEALGFGLPVITTDRASLPEVTMGLAHLIRDPLDPGELADAILEVLRNPSAHRKSPEDIRRVRKQYDPAAIGKRYYELLGG